MSKIDYKGLPRPGHDTTFQDLNTGDCFWWGNYSTPCMKANIDGVERSIRLDGFSEIHVQPDTLVFPIENLKLVRVRS